MSIIPDLHPELNDIIIYNMDIPSCLALSQVSTLAQAALTNGFFQNRFFNEYPLLKKFQNDLFPLLYTTHPDCCWKIVCDVFSKEFPSQIASVRVCAQHNTKKRNISFQFFIHQTPSMCRTFELAKTQCQSQRTEICGIHFQDPNSPIHKAWKAIKTKEQENQFLENKFRETQNALQPFHQGEMRSILKLLHQQGEQLFPNGEIGEELRNAADEDILPLKRECFPLYSLLLKLMQETSTTKLKLKELKSAYQQLERKRVDLLKNQDKIESSLDLLIPFLPETQEGIELIDRMDDYHAYFQFLEEKEILKMRLESTQEEFMHFKLYGFLAPDGMSIEEVAEFTNMEIRSINHELECINKKLSHKKFCFNENPVLKQMYFQYFKNQQCSIHAELSYAMRKENDLIKRAHLKECALAITMAIEEPSTKLLQHIAFLINSNEKRDITFIWGNLYNECANGYQQDRWSELHFHEFLPELLDIVNERAELYRD